MKKPWIFRSQQEDAIRKDREESFVRSMVPHLREQFPKHTVDRSDDDLDSLVRSALELAESYGIQIERDLARFLGLTVVHGLKFKDLSEGRWVEEYLRDPEVPGVSQRVLRAHEKLLQRLKTEERNRRLRQEFEDGI